MPKPDGTSDALQKFLTIGRKPNAANIRLLNHLLSDLGLKMDVRTIVDSAEARSVRQKLIRHAAKRGADLAKLRI